MFPDPACRPITAILDLGSVFPNAQEHLFSTLNDFTAGYDNVFRLSTRNISCTLHHALSIVFQYYYAAPHLSSIITRSDVLLRFIKWLLTILMAFIFSHGFFSSHKLCRWVRQPWWDTFLSTRWTFLPMVVFTRSWLWPSFYVVSGSYLP